MLNVTINRLRLLQFRNHQRIDLRPISGCNLLLGNNAVGKTNILEAISLFSSRRGIRNAKNSEISSLGYDASWSVFAELKIDQEIHKLGVGYVNIGNGKWSRRSRHNYSDILTTNFAELVSILWLLPDYLRIFSSSPSERRNYLDDMVAVLKPSHLETCRIQAALLRQRRAALLRYSKKEILDSLEKQLAYSAVKIASNRLKVIKKLNEFAQIQFDNNLPFPRFELSMPGKIENVILSGEDLFAVSEQYCNLLCGMRQQDTEAGRTTVGSHCSDLLVRHCDKGIIGKMCSAGEQKGLLIGIFLAHEALTKHTYNRHNILLLDEITNHLDARYTKSLFSELNKRECQIFITSADTRCLDYCSSKTKIFEIGTT